MLKQIGQQSKHIRFSLNLQAVPTQGRITRIAFKTVKGINHRIDFYIFRDKIMTK